MYVGWRFIFFGALGFLVITVTVSQRHREQGVANAEFGGGSGSVGLNLRI